MTHDEPLMPPGLGFRPPPASDFCPHCARPMPTSLLDAVFFLAGSPGLQGRDREFVENLRALLLRGLELSPGHREQLLGLYRSRHALDTAAYRGRWARIVEAVHV